MGTSLSSPSKRATRGKLEAGGAAACGSCHQSEAQPAGGHPVPRPCAHAAASSPRASSPSQAPAPHSGFLWSSLSSDFPPPLPASLPASDLPSGAGRGPGTTAGAVRSSPFCHLPGARPGPRGAPRTLEPQPQKAALRGILAHEQETGSWARSPFGGFVPLQRRFLAPPPCVAMCL